MTAEPFLALAGLLVGLYARRRNSRLPLGVAAALLLALPFVQAPSVIGCVLAFAAAGVVFALFDRELRTADAAARRAEVLHAELQTERARGALDTDLFPEEGDLVALVRATAGSFCGEAKKAGVTLLLRTEAPEISAVFDRAKLELVVQTAAREAIAVSAPGAEVVVSIRRGAHGGNSTVWITAESSAPARAPDPRSPPLLLAARAVALHGGEIAVDGGSVNAWFPSRRARPRGRE